MVKYLNASQAVPVSPTGSVPPASKVPTHCLLIATKAQTIFLIHADGIKRTGLESHLVPESSISDPDHFRLTGELLLIEQQKWDGGDSRPSLQPLHSSMFSSTVGEEAWPGK
ncbi:hypothetical protein NPIL_400621 [Nephila pilipes]|uniref:Uncharacterized protein n=1 Tax=Nephila pilipes TaxID=299642 RepID=A0A8X6NFD3_NEPPI|nr:hypothetical protein NPIL_400621 [Nephila pilipes]